jgi:hypothetical protein
MDYSECSSRTEEFVNRYDELTRSSPEDDSDIFNDLLMHSFDSPLARAKTDNPALLASKIHKANNPSEANSESEIDRSIRSNINQLLESSSPLCPLPVQETPLRLKDTIPSAGTVLCFYYEGDVELRHVYNLFSNFGNVAGIVKKRNALFVRFRSMEFASISYTYLNNYRFMGNYLVLQSPATDADALPREGEWSECIFFDETYDRYVLC